ncbi:4Fe-4S dicluster domain-containing protein [Escherichia coli]
MHCEDSGLPMARPSAGAIIQYANGIVDFQSENCIGCCYCIAGCPFRFRASTKRITGYRNVRSCVDRVSVGEELACLKPVRPGLSTSAPRRRCWSWRNSAWRN